MEGNTFEMPLTILRASSREYVDRAGNQKELREVSILDSHNNLMTIGASARGYSKIADLKNQQGTATLRLNATEDRGRAFVEIDDFVYA